MRRVRGGRVGGESEAGHGQGQTITRSEMTLRPATLKP